MSDPLKGTLEITPEWFWSHRRGGRPQCWKCVAESGAEIAEFLSQGALKAMGGLCPLHYAEVPTVLRQALRDNPLDPERDGLADANRRRQTLYEEVELESAAQWSALLGRPVYPEERVDAITFLARGGSYVE